MAILPTDHLSLYFVGIVPQDAVFIIDDDAPEELQCPEDTVELQVRQATPYLGQCRPPLPRCTYNRPHAPLNDKNHTSTI